MPGKVSVVNENMYKIIMEFIVKKGKLFIDGELLSLTR